MLIIIIINNTGKLYSDILLLISCLHGEECRLLLLDNYIQWSKPCLFQQLKLEEGVNIRGPHEIQDILYAQWCGVSSVCWGDSCRKTAVNCRNDDRYGCIFTKFTTLNSELPGDCFQKWAVIMHFSLFPRVLWRSHPWSYKSTSFEHGHTVCTLIFTVISQKAAS